MIAVGLLLAGCKLVDQTTFAPSPEPATAAAPTPKAETRTALVTINYATPHPDYRDVLRFAVNEAERRAPRVQYDVVGMLPAGGDAADAQRRVAEVMRSIMAQRVPADRIHLGLRTAQADTQPEVRIYVR